mgnify:FL=1
MKFILFLLHLAFCFLLAILLFIPILFVFKPIFLTSHLIIPYAIYPFDICIKAPIAWKYMKIIYCLCCYHVCFLFSNSIYSLIFKNKIDTKVKKENVKPNSGINLYLGNNALTNAPVYLTERGLYQNFLITGTIGTGKTSSSMYPYTKQLIEYNADNAFEKLGMLILDVKGNFYKQVKIYAEEYNRTDDLCVIELGGNVRYNPLDKPNLKPSVLANRLKTILTLFSPNNSESYWLDKAEEVLCECIKLCRLYNNGYVTFTEIHRLVNSPNYYNEKVCYLRELFRTAKLNHHQIYELHSALTFFETEYRTLDSRVLSILKSEITRMTNVFISDYDIMQTFCPEKKDVTFNGFKDVLEQGKIVVLNMNIALFKNLSKIIAAYLKLDFQAEILSQLAHNNVRPSVFICDEFHEYVTATDSDFFAQSREAKCINIVATQSYTSLLNSLKDQYAVKSIIQNLINKLWYRTDDAFTIEDAQKQIGKEDKTKISKSISENAQETNYNYITNSLNSNKSSVSESITTHINTDFVYDTNFFTQHLETFSCLSFLSNGDKILPPTKLKMQPYFLDNSPKKKGLQQYKII